MIRFLRIAFWIGLSSLPLPAAAEGRFALVIGIAEYDSARDLANPVADASAVADHLRKLNFEVTTETDRDARRLRRALEDFAEDAAGADLALVYYAGHGVEVGGQNRLLPSDAALGSLDELTATTVPLADVVDTLRRVAPAAVLLVDACRNDPFEGTPLAGLAQRAAEALDHQTAAALAPGFARVGRADGLVYAFATAPGATAEDGKGANSPFAAAILRHLGTQGLELRSALSLIQQDVYDRTRGRQLPYVESALPDLIFVAGPPGEMSERDRLLMAMAGLAPEARAEVERIAAEGNLPLAPLYAALLAAGDLSAAEREATLTEAAGQFQAFQDWVGALDGTDPAVAALRDEAARLMELGIYQEAQEKLQAAADLDAAAAARSADILLARSLSQVDTLRSSALAAEAALDHATALARWREITALLSRLEPLGLPEDGQKTQTTALWWEGHLLIGLGDGAAALPVYEEWHRRAAARAMAAPDDTALQHDLANSLRELGNLLGRRGQTGRARALLTEAQLIWRRLSTAEPDNVQWLRHLGFTFTDLGGFALDLDDLDEAEASFLGGMDIWQRLAAQAPQDADLRNDLAVGHSRLGSVYALTGRLSDAAEEYRTALDLWQALVAEKPESTLFSTNLGDIHARLAATSLKMGATGAAETYARAALDLREALAAKDTARSGATAGVASSREQLGIILREKGDLAGALTEFDAALELTGRLTGQDGGNIDWLQRQKSLLDERGFTHSLMGNLTQAEADYRAALAIAEDLVLRAPDAVYLRHNLALSHIKIGNTLLSRDLAAEAQSHFLTAIDGLEAIGAATSDRTHWPDTLASALVGLGDAILRQGGDLPAATEAYRRALDLRLRLSGADPANADLRYSLALSYSRLGTALESAGDRAAAESAYVSGLEIRQSLLALDPLNQQNRQNLAVAQGRLCDLLRNGGDPARAEVYCRDRLATRRYLLELAPDVALNRENLAEALIALGRLVRDTGRLSEAEGLFLEELEVRTELAAADPQAAEPQRALAWSRRRITGVLRQRGAAPAAILPHHLAELEAWLRLEARLGTDAEAEEQIMTVFGRMAEDLTDDALLQQEVMDLLLRLQAAGDLTADRAAWIGYMQEDPGTGVIVAE